MALDLRKINFYWLLSYPQIYTFAFLGLETFARNLAQFTHSAQNETEISYLLLNEN